MAETPWTIAGRLGKVRDSAQETAGEYDGRDGDQAGRWGELSAAMSELANMIEEARAEAVEVASTYAAEVGPGAGGGEA